jgi:hypothetical protein
MATIETKRGFVQRIEIGRAGLVVVTLLHEDGATAEYHIRDLDADPERFNERLSKLGVLRDAMTRGEPVEIECSREDKAGAPRLIERATRITRDSGWLAQHLETLDALVADVSVFAENRAAAAGEKADTAKVSVITGELTRRELTLDLQIPERDVAGAQLKIILEAKQQGMPLRFYVDSENQRITGVATDASLQQFGRDNGTVLDGFVEALSLVLTVGGTDDLAVVRFITAPPFSGAGNVVALTPFTPDILDLLVFRESTNYKLFEAGLRDNLRMRVKVLTVAGGYKERQPKGKADESAGGAPAAVAKKSKAGSYAGMAATTGDEERPEIVFVTGAELLAPLASASRPVWIKISRKTLDEGPDGFECTVGVPSSDLSPQTLRDLRLPYPAVWTGWGCFNHGVYRFQFDLPGPFEISVDGKPLCLHDADIGGIKFAHACLGGEHEVKVKVENWTCDKQFIMDVYRIR